MVSARCPCTVPHQHSQSVESSCPPHQAAGGAGGRSQERGAPERAPRCRPGAGVNGETVLPIIHVLRASYLCLRHLTEHMLSNPRSSRRRSRPCSRSRSTQAEQCCMPSARQTPLWSSWRRPGPSWLVWMLGMELAQPSSRRVCAHDRRILSTIRHRRHCAHKQHHTGSGTHALRHQALWLTRSIPPAAY